MATTNQDNIGVSLFFIVAAIIITACTGVYASIRISTVNAITQMDHESIAYYTAISALDRSYPLLKEYDNPSAITQQLKQRYEHGPAQRRAYRLLKHDANLHINIDGLFCQFNHTQTGALSSVFPCEEMDEYYSKWTTGNDVKWGDKHITYDILSTSSER